MLVVPENVQTGTPPFLKCGLVAIAAVVVSASSASPATRQISARFIRSPPCEAPQDVTGRSHLLPGRWSPLGPLGWCDERSAAAAIPQRTPTLRPTFVTSSA